MKSFRFLMVSAVLLMAVVSAASAESVPPGQPALSTGPAASAQAALSTGPAASARPALSVGPATSAEPAHIVTGFEMQSTFDQKVHSEAADRQMVRDLLARPDVRRVAGSMGIDLERAGAAVGTLSGPELSRVAKQAREANSQLSGGAVTMTTTVFIILVVALVLLIAAL